MAYITREDGEHFVIPSYRDVLAAKNKTQLKKDILLLSQSYGEYITLQTKGINQYEIAFSTDTGYLLGESIWHQFKRPLDMIYCERIPNTTEVILVIVKAGSVYLDGSFPIESIPEELVIFLTQQNNFEIYVYGDVPISETPEMDKFSFEANSVKSFTVLDKPVFPTLPLLKIYQLQLVDQVLKAHGIGVLPIRRLLVIFLILGAGYWLWTIINEEKPVEQAKTPQVNPYQAYNAALNSPSADKDMNQLISQIKLLFTMPPGWSPVTIKYANGASSSVVKSSGTSIQALFDWAKQNTASVDIKGNAITVTINRPLPKRGVPTKIYPLKDVIAHYVDALATVYPGNHIRLGDITAKGVYSDMIFTVNISDVSPISLALIGEQMKDLPFVIQNAALTVNNGAFSGTITIQALGS